MFKYFNCRISCACLHVFTGQNASNDTSQDLSPRRLRQRVIKHKTVCELQAEEFEKDFDSPNPSPHIQFKRTWDCRPWEKQKRRTSRRLKMLPPCPLSVQPTRSSSNKRKADQDTENTSQPDPQELILENNVRVYRSPKMGWNSLTRRVVQHGYLRMNCPSEYDENGNHQWSGNNGVISQLQNFAGITGWRSRKVIRQIMKKMKSLAPGQTYDAGIRESSRKPKKRKMTQSDVDLAGKMLRNNSGSQWATIAVNNKIEAEGRGQKAKVSRRTLERTLKKKYDAIVHRRQTKGTGSKDVNSIWAIARNALSRQLLVQLGFTGDKTKKTEVDPASPQPDSSTPDEAPQPDPSPPDKAPQPDPSPPDDAPQPTSPSDEAPQPEPSPPDETPQPDASPSDETPQPDSSPSDEVPQPDPSPADEKTPEHPDAPFQVGDRVRSRYNQGARYSKDFFLGVVHHVLKIDIGRRNRFLWKFIVQFDDGSTDEVDYTNRISGVNNIRYSNEPFPDPPTPPPSPIPAPDDSPVVDPAPTQPPPPSNPTEATTLSPTPSPSQPTVTNPRPGQHPTWVSIQLPQILFLDEKHVKCKLGHVSGYEWLMVLDPTDPNKLRSLKHGGVREKPKPYTKPKHPKEARALFGVGLDKDGNGMKMPMFDYTDKKVNTCVCMYN